MKKNIYKLGLLLAIFGLMTGNQSFATTDIFAPSTNPVFRFVLYNTGETVIVNDNGKIEKTTSDFTLAPELRNSLQQAGEYWSSILKRDSGLAPVEITVITQQKIDGASGGSSEHRVGAETFKRTLLNAQYNNLPVDATQGVNAIFIGNKSLPFSHNELSVMAENDIADLNTVIAHEMGHALGILANAKKIPNTNKFSFGDLSVYTKNLKVNGISAAPNMEIEVNDASRTGVFNIAENAPYFTGTETMKVLDPDNTGATFAHYQGTYKNDDGSLQRVAGLPINGIENDDEGIIPELSHIELRNSYMSHQDYRNWTIFMEAELAVLKDLGYTIDLREHFGKSYYLDYQTTTNTIGFAQSDGSGGYNSSVYNESPFGVGLHIYGNHNKITQAQDILSSGKVSTGARIDGVENTLKVKTGTKIDMQGENSIGILTSYGKDHTITIENNAEVTATGEGGIGVAFNFGKNILGSEMAHQGSYMRTEKGEEQYAPKDIQGPLVKTFNVNGTLEGEKAAIYIDDTAFVKEININNGATIKGDILSNWNAQSSVNAKIQNDYVRNEDKDPTSGLLLTNLNFNNYDQTYTNDIKGQTIILNNKTGNLTLDGNANVYRVNNEASSTLSGPAKYDVQENFNNSGTYNATNGAEISAKNLVNTGTINLESGNFKLDIEKVSDETGMGTLNIGTTGASTVDISNNVESIENSVIIANNSTLNLANNNNTADIEITEMTFNSDVNMTIDVNLANQTADRLKFEEDDDLTTNGHTLNITNIGIVNNIDRATPTQANFNIPLVSSDLHNENLNINFTASMPKETLTTAIFKYNMNYDSVNNRFMFNAPFGGGSDNYKNFNPAILAGPVAAQVGSFLTQISSYNQAFSNFDMMMAIPREQRQAMKYANKFASADNGVLTYSPNQIPEEDRGLWFKPYAIFETVNLHKGPSVGNTAYGTYFGGDTGILEIGKGWDVVYAGYGGYNGSHQTYDGIGVYQNGGQLGGSAFAYKNNFWSGVTVNLGANVGRANNKLGHDDFTTLATGIASKTGYNFEFNRGKFIVQPSLLLSYSFINMFDYTNSAGLRVKSDPLNAIQIAPGLKFIGNIGDGWQPYLGVQMIWNLIDKTRFTAANVSMPDMSVDPYVQYGIGLQKRCGDRFTGFAQAMLRNGGSNGVSLSAGFRWAIGK